MQVLLNYLRNITWFSAKKMNLQKTLQNVNMLVKV